MDDKELKAHQRGYKIGYEDGKRAKLAEIQEILGIVNCSCDS